MIPTMYLKDLIFLIFTLVRLHYVNNLNFVTNQIYFLICLILDFGIFNVLPFCQQCDVGLFSQLYYWWFYFSSFLCLYFLINIFLLWPLFFFAFQTFALKVILDLKFEFWGTFFWILLAKVTYDEPIKGIPDNHMEV